MGCVCCARGGCISGKKQESEVGNDFYKRLFLQMTFTNDCVGCGNARQSPSLRKLGKRMT